MHSKIELPPLPRAQACADPQCGTVVDPKVNDWKYATTGGIIHRYCTDPALRVAR